MIINAGILIVIYRDDYNDKMADELLNGMLKKFEGDIE
jgi:deoxycytidylate deaminase